MEKRAVGVWGSQLQQPAKGHERGKASSRTRFNTTLIDTQVPNFPMYFMHISDHAAHFAIGAAHSQAFGKVRMALSRSARG
jgi:hypothetical protein